MEEVCNGGSVIEEVLFVACDGWSATERVCRMDYNGGSVIGRTLHQ